MIMCKTMKPCAKWNDDVQTGMTCVQTGMTCVQTGLTYVQMGMTMCQMAWPRANTIGVNMIMSKSAEQCAYHHDHVQYDDTMWKWARKHYHMLMGIWLCASTIMIMCKTMKPCAKSHDDVQMGMTCVQTGITMCQLAWPRANTIGMNMLMSKSTENVLITMIMCKTM